MFYFTKTPAVIRQLFKHTTWKLPNGRSAVYLTFDDGPIPYITEQTLDVLNQYAVKATFFCVGQNVEKNPSIYHRILEEGHQVGNHSYNHLNGWNTENETYLSNIEKCNQLVQSKLLRPPYGKINRSQISALKEHYTIVMWDVLSGDFDPKTTVEKTIENVLNAVEAGSIIVLHDNEKCGAKMLQALPQIIMGIKEKGFVFETIPV